MHHDIVGGVEALALEPVDENREGSVQFDPGDPAAAVFAGDQAALPVAVGLLKEAQADGWLGPVAAGVRR